MERKTLLSDCQNYRWTLWRDWSNELADRGAMTLHFTEDPHGDYYPGKPDTYVNFIMLNPSTADATTPDNTTTKCIGFAKSWGFGAVCLTNLFAYRSRDPRQLRKVKDPVGEKNDEWVKTIASGAGLVVVAWGNDGRLMERDKHVLQILQQLNITAKSLGAPTGQGQPRHPLYPKYQTELLPFPS